MNSCVVQGKKRSPSNLYGISTYLNSHYSHDSRICLYCI
uniref:Uncharacterized protein n=1 Tax=Utricularia reniformis TaxID=192314 RepID=A0A1Y0B337_9LAMI|nr:hypothetical protein AEK19_MT1637 [Utricularia reniformis]ART31821.1 hypothetical protein AEK19_MT1637 [Utricularia reniformis]